MKKEGKIELKASQEDWKKYKNTQIKLYDLAFPRFATMFTNIRAACICDLYKQRADELEGIYKLITR